jgi:hypothetical protein
LRELQAQQRDHRNHAVGQDAEHKAGRDCHFARRRPGEQAQRLVTVRADWNSSYGTEIK